MGLFEAGQLLFQVVDAAAGVVDGGAALGHFGGEGRGAGVGVVQAEPQLLAPGSLLRQLALAGRQLVARRRQPAKRSRQDLDYPKTQSNFGRILIESNGRQVEQDSIWIDHWLILSGDDLSRVRSN